MFLHLDFLALLLDGITRILDQLQCRYELCKSGYETKYKACSHGVGVGGDGQDAAGKTQDHPPLTSSVLTNIQQQG